MYIQYPVLSITLMKTLKDIPGTSDNNFVSIGVCQHDIPGSFCCEMWPWGHDAFISSDWLLCYWKHTFLRSHKVVTSIFSQDTCLPVVVMREQLLNTSRIKTVLKCDPNVLKQWLRSEHTVQICRPQSFRRVWGPWSKLNELIPLLTWLVKQIPLASMFNKCFRFLHQICPDFLGSGMIPNLMVWIVQK